MVSRVLILCLLCSSHALGGKTIRLSSPSFSLSITEPEGWTLDVSSVAQIAHVALHPQGIPWRESDLVIFGRFVPRSTHEKREDFLDEDEKRFVEQCPFADTSPLNLELKGHHDFLLKAYECTGFQSEIVAIAEVQSHFVIFTLTSQTGVNPRLEIETLREVLNEFQWIPKSRTLSRETLHPPPR